MAVNRAVSSHLDRVGLPGLTYRTWRSCDRTDGTAAPWWRFIPRASPPDSWNEEYKPAIPLGDGSAACPGLSRPTGGRSRSPRAWNGMGSAPGGRRTWRSAQGAPNLAYCALRGELISSTGRVSQQTAWHAPAQLVLFEVQHFHSGEVAQLRRYIPPLNWSFPQRLSHFSQYGSIQGLAQSPRECGSSVFRAILRDPPKLCGCNVRYRNANPSGISHGR